MKNINLLIMMQQFHLFIQLQDFSHTRMLLNYLFTLGLLKGLRTLGLNLNDLAVRYFIVGLIVILLRGIVTEIITKRMMARADRHAA